MKLKFLLFSCLLIAVCNSVLSEPATNNTPPNSYGFIIDSVYSNINGAPKLQNPIEISKVPTIKIEPANPIIEETNYLSKEWLAVYLSAALTLITLSLAFYTFKLWHSTNQVVLDSREATQNQLRAYVNIMGANLSPYKDPFVGEVPGAPPAYFDLAIKNWGQTPAHKFCVQVNFHSEPYGQPLPESFEYPDKERELGPGQQKKKRGVSVMAPDQSATFTPALNQEELTELEMSKNNQINLYIYGWVRYTDIFAIERESQFCYLVGHYAHGNFSPFTNYHEHNTAT